MDFHLNLATNRFVRAAGVNAVVSTAELKARDTVTLDVYFWNGMAAAELAEGSDLVFVLKTGVASGAATLALIDDWDLVEPGHYRAALDLNTVPLDAALGDVASVVVVGELTWSGDAGVSWESSNTLRVTLLNDVYKGVEGTPLELPEPAAWLLGNSAPVTEAEAASATLVADTDNTLVWTADVAGAAGNSLTGAIAIEADSTVLVAVKDGHAVVLTSGDKRLLVVSGAETAGVNGALVRADTGEGNPEWTSNGLSYAANHGETAFTVVELGGTGEASVERYDAGGTLVYKADSDALEGGDFPDEMTFQSPTTGTGTPTVAASAATAEQGRAAINAAALGVTATHADGSAGTAVLVAVAATAFSGGLDVSSAPPYLRVADGKLYVQEAGVWKQAALSALS
jgi:hypothetical protein